MSPSIIPETLATNLNEHGNPPKAINKGILTLIQKDGQRKEPIENLRPILLLTATRKILAYSLLNKKFARISLYHPRKQHIN